MSDRSLLDDINDSYTKAKKAKDKGDPIPMIFLCIVAVVIVVVLLMVIL